MGDAHMGPVAAAIPQMDWYERGLDGKSSLRIILGEGAWSWSMRLCLCD